MSNRLDADFIRSTKDLFGFFRLMCNTAAIFVGLIFSQLAHATFVGFPPEENKTKVLPQKIFYDVMSEQKIKLGNLDLSLGTTQLILSKREFADFFGTSDKFLIDQYPENHLLRDFLSGNQNSPWLLSWPDIFSEETNLILQIQNHLGETLFENSYNKKQDLIHIEKAKETLGLLLPAIDQDELEDWAEHPLIRFCLTQNDENDDSEDSLSFISICTEDYQVIKKKSVSSPSLPEVNQNSFMVQRANISRKDQKMSKPWKFEVLVNGQEITERGEIYLSAEPTYIKIQSREAKETSNKEDPTFRNNLDDSSTEDGVKEIDPEFSGPKLILSLARREVRFLSFNEFDQEHYQVLALFMPTDRLGEIPFNKLKIQSFLIGKNNPKLDLPLVGKFQSEQIFVAAEKPPSLKEMNDLTNKEWNKELASGPSPAAPLLNTFRRSYVKSFQSEASLIMNQDPKKYSIAKTGKKTYQVEFKQLKKGLNLERPITLANKEKRKPLSLIYRHPAWSGKALVFTSNQNNAWSIAGEYRLESLGLNTWDEKRFSLELSGGSYSFIKNNPSGPSFYHFLLNMSQTPFELWGGLKFGLGLKGLSFGSEHKLGPLLQLTYLSTEGLNWELFDRMEMQLSFCSLSGLKEQTQAALFFVKPIKSQRLAFKYGGFGNHDNLRSPSKSGSQNAPFLVQESPYDLGLALSIEMQI